MDDQSRLLRQHNLKVTPQRTAILKHLLHSHAHPTAEMIFNDIVIEYPSMSLATVYKTLDTLTNERIITEFNIGEDSNRYDSNRTPHAHFRCTCCSTVIDIELPNFFENIDEEVSKAYGIKIVDSEMSFYGNCQSCDLT